MLRNFSDRAAGLRRLFSVAMPLRHHNDTIWIESRLLQYVHHRNNFVLLKIDHGYGAVAHIGKIEEAVLHKDIATIGRKHEVMRACGRGNFGEELGAIWVRNVEDIQGAGVT